jgi:hypothetical protein
MCFRFALLRDHDRLEDVWSDTGCRAHGEPSLPSPDTGYIQCSNVHLQRGTWAVNHSASRVSDRQAVRVGISNVSGYGLFADEDIAKGTTIIGKWRSIRWT